MEINSQTLEVNVVVKRWSRKEEENGMEEKSDSAVRHRPKKENGRTDLNAKT